MRSNRASAHFKKHRELVLDQLKRRPKRPDPSLNLGGPDLATTPQVAGGRRDPTDQRRSWRSVR